MKGQHFLFACTRPVRMLVQPGDRPFTPTWACSVICCIALPSLVGPYWLAVIRDALIMGLLAMSYALLWGRAGILTLGHTVFLGLGAYGYAVMTVQYGFSPLSAMAAGLLCATVVAMTTGYFLLYAGVRLHFFAIVSMAILIVAQQLATSWQSVTGGDTGLLGIPPVSIDLAGTRLDVGGPLASWCLVCTAALVTALGIWWRCRGRYGRLLTAIATNEQRARACGYDTSRRLLGVYVVSALLAAMAGVLMAACSGVVGPDVFSPLLATEVILWVAIGGRDSIMGPAFAAVVLTLLREFISSVSTQWWPLILGSVFLACVIALPDGLRPLAMLSKVFRRAGRTRRASGISATQPASSAEGAQR